MSLFINTNILSSNEKIEQWPIYDSSHTFKYSNFSITEKEKLFKIISKYYIYCNKKDTKSIPQFVGENKKIFIFIVNYLFLNCINKEWSNKFKIRMNYVLFLKEYFNYIEHILDEEDDSFLVNKIFKELKNKSIKSLSSTQISEFFLDILKEYDSVRTDKYDLSKIKNIMYRIIDEKLKLNKPNFQEFGYLLKQFNKYIAGLTTEDFENINEIRNSNGYKYPNVYRIELKSDNFSDSKEIQIISNKRSRDKLPVLNDSEIHVLPKNKKIKEVNIVTNFLNKISENTYSDVLLLRKLVKDADERKIVSQTNTDKREIVIQTNIDKREIVIQTDIDKKKEFIKSLPSNIFVLLKSKGGINYSGFIKPVLLTQDEELLTNPDILMSLYDNGLIKEP